MCIAPVTLANGQQIACRKCKLCRFNRVKDWAGRNVAQSKVSTASFAGDLTYGRVDGETDHIRATVLTYSDVQKFLKYLRWLGYRFQYFITGENGSLKGRAHWHFILHFHGKVPKVVLEKNFSDRHKNEDGELFDMEVCKAWPHGFMYWKKASYEDVFYNCKYILKDEGDENSQRKPGLSKKPPIGTVYFRKIAEQHVRQGISPQTLQYRIAGVKKKNGDPVEFYLQGRSAELYLEHFIATWERERPERPRPKSDLVDLYEEYGQVVHDETALLVRREFPKGESRAAMPTGGEIKAAAERAQAEADTWRRTRAMEEADEWFDIWVDEAKDEQERSKRQAERERSEREREERRCSKQHQKGLVFQYGKGWFRPQAGERCQCGHHDIYPGGAQPERAGERIDQPDYGAGEVGRWNRHYGDKAQAQAQARSEAGGEAGAGV